MKINVENYFKYYIIHPLDKKLSTIEKVVSTLASAALLVLTAGIAHLVCYTCYGYSQPPYTHPVQTKVNKFAHNTVPLKPQKTPSQSSFPTSASTPSAVKAVSVHTSPQATVISISPITAPQTVSKDLFREYLGGTSDHTWKTYQMETVSENQAASVKVKVGTWNTADRMSYPGPGKISNNPFNHNDTDIEYLDRKRAQFQEIRTLIQGGTFDGFTVEAVDTLVLQEVDFWYFGSKIDYQQKKSPKELNGWQQTHLTLYQEFKKMLAECGYEMITTDARLSKEKQDPMITLYNPKKMTPQTTFLRGCFAQPHHKGGLQFRGGEALFTHLASNKSFAITNLHLMFNVPPQEAITKYQNEQIAAGIATLSLGDLNNPPNKNDLSSAMIDWNHATNVDAETTADRGDPKKLSIKDGKFNKAYDAALANPGGPNEQVVVTETETAFFDKKTDGDGFKLGYIDLQRVHPSLPGRAWMRNKDLEKILKEEYDNLIDPKFSPFKHKRF